MNQTEMFLNFEIFENAYQQIALSLINMKPFIGCRSRLTQVNGFWTFDSRLSTLGSGLSYIIGWLRDSTAAMSTTITETHHRSSEFYGFPVKRATHYYKHVHYRTWLLVYTHRYKYVRLKR